MCRRNPDHAEYLGILFGWECSRFVRKHTFQLGGHSCIPRVQWPSIEASDGAGIVLHGTSSISVQTEYAMLGRIKASARGSGDTRRVQK